MRYRLVPTHQTQKSFASPTGFCGGGKTLLSNGYQCQPDELLNLTLGQVSTHALVPLNPYGRIVGWHAGSERIFGYSPGDVLDKNVEILFTPEDLEPDSRTGD